MEEARKLFSKVLAIQHDRGETIEMHKFGSCGNDVHKLDVLHSRQINRVIKLYVAVLALALVYTVVSAVLAGTVFLRHQQLALGDGREVRIRAVGLPRAYSWFDYIPGIAVFFINLPLALAFTTRVTASNRRKVTEEQLWIVMLLFASAIATFPLNSIVSINDRLLRTAWGAKPQINRVRGLFFCLQAGAANAASLFYLWVSAHTYGNVDKPDRQSIKWKFHAPEFVAFVLYLAASLYAALDWKFFVDTVPFATLPSFVVVTRTLGVLQTDRLVFVVGYTMLEVFFVVLICARVRKTNRLLNETDYLKCRSKRISFRFFVFNNLLYYSTAVLSHVFLHCVVPKNNTLKYLNDSPPLMLNRNHDCTAALAILNTAYLLVSAYVHLPPEATGLRGWVCCDEKTAAKSDSNVPITLQARELHAHPASLTSTSSVSSQHRDSVVMETHCELFNFAWLAYEWYRMPDALDDTPYCVKRYIRCEENDVHVLIIDCVDRIVLSFKGTSSLKNIKTDLRIMPVPVNQYLPCVGTYFKPEVLQVLNSREWPAAYSHAGFTEAYSAVQGEVMHVLESMLHDKRRPVMLTGHSLGGALATICALDIRLSLALSDEDILMVSFGAPRCGNADFQVVYDKLVPLTWRVCLNRDVVTGLPKFGYVHLGRCVLLTTDGDIYVDPSHLDYLLMTAEVQTSFFHKKPAYMIALRAFCRRYLKSYQPKFWDFRIPHEYQDLWKATLESFDSQVGSNVA